MVALRISEFQGAAPRLSPEALSGFQGQVVTDCRLWNRKLKPWNGRLNVKAVAAGVKTILNLQGNWLTFNTDVDVCPSQIAGDQVGRIFYTGAGAPQMSDLSMALIGKTSVVATSVTPQALPGAVINTTIAALGLNVGDTINSSVQMTDPNAAIVNGYAYIAFYTGAGALISEADSSFINGCGEYQVAVLTGVVIPANTVTIKAGGWAASSSAGALQRCFYLTKGNFSASTLPVASVPLGIAQPAAPVASYVNPTVNITGATCHSAAIPNGGNAVVACDGTEIKVSGVMRFMQSSNANMYGTVTVNLLRDAAVVASQDFAMNARGSAAEPGVGSIRGEFNFTDQPPAGNHTYSFSITTDFGGAPTIATAHGTISFDSAVDVTVTGWTANHAQVVGSTIVDSNGGLQMAIAATGNTGAAAPAWAVQVGGKTVDGGVTWVLIYVFVAGTPLSIAGVVGLTDINANATVVSVTGNSIRIGIDSSQTYTSGGVLGVTLHNAAGIANSEDRVYAYTYVVDLDGEAMESEPSPASALLAVEPGRLVSVALPATPAGLSITTANLYRTVADGQGGAVLVFVTAIPTVDGVVPTPYYDAQADTQLSGTLSTATWAPPPPDMIGLVALPNGVYVGFNSNQIIPSFPYQPQAYPVAYQLGTEYPIVAIKPFGQSLAVLTAGKPYVVDGLDPSTWAMRNIDMNQPCLSKRGAVDMGYGVVYPCPEGLAMVSTSGVKVVTEDVFSQDTWQALNPASMLAANYAGLYVCFYTGNGGGGFIFNPLDPLSYTALDFQATAMWTDPATNFLYMVVANEIVQWDADPANPLTYTWQSKDYVLPHPLNLARAKVRARAYPVTLNLYGDGVLRFTKVVANASAFSMPSGYRAQVYSVSVTGTQEVLEIVVAESAAEMGAGMSQMTSMQAPVG